MNFRCWDREQADQNPRDGSRVGCMQGHEPKVSCDAGSPVMVALARTFAYPAARVWQ